MATRRLLISGRVQGVFFRAWTVQHARSLGLSGWVRNLRSGEVEVLAAGVERALDELVRRCWDGPPDAQVAGIVATEAAEEVEPGFRQIRTE